MCMSGLYSQVRTYNRFNPAQKSRKYGFKDGCSRLVELTETITAPRGWELKSGTIEGEATGKAASCSMSITAEGSSAIIRNTLTMGKRVYEAEDWAEVREALRIHHSAEQNLIFVK